MGRDIRQFTETENNIFDVAAEVIKQKDKRIRELERFIEARGYDVPPPLKQTT